MSRPDRPAEAASVIRRRPILAAGLAALGGLAAPRTLRAQSYPTRPIRFIVPGPASGAADVLGRIVCDKLGPRLGQPVVVENRPGAATNIGMTALAQSAPDGYTLGMGSIASNAVNKWIYRSLPFNPERDFTPITLIALVPNIMVVSPSLPVTSVKEFVDYAKKNPGQLNYGSVGAGSSQHLAGVQFNLATGADMLHIPYSNSGQLNGDLIEGRVQVLFQSVSAVAEMAKAGRMRALAVTGTERLPAFPEVPTLQEAGFDIVSTGWFGAVAPAGTPEPILERLNAETVALIREPEVTQRIIGLGSVPRPGSRADFAAWMAQETDRWGKVTKAAGVTVD